MINYREVILRIVRDFDPSIDLSDNSPFVSDVLEPLVKSLAHDPYATNISKFIRTRLQQEHGIVLHEGSYLEDIMDKGVQTILEPYRREIQRVSLAQSFLNRPIMSDADVESLAANTFTVREQGAFSYVTVRAYYTSPLDEEVQTDNLARSRNGLLFVPSRNQSISRSQMSLQKEGTLYYWDILFVAAEPGDQYNIAENQIASVDSLAAVKVTNLSRARNGLPRDSNTDLILRAAQANAQATLATSLGINHTLSKQFASLVSKISVVGHGHPQMQRDLLQIKGDYHAEIVTYATFPLTISASDVSLYVKTQHSEYTISIAAAAYATPFTLANAINTAWVAAGGNGFIAFPWQNSTHKGIRFISDGSEKGEESTLQLIAVANDMYDKFYLDAAMSISLSTVVGDIYTGGLAGEATVGFIPGGILDPTTPEGNATYPVNQVHIGAGATDIYVLPKGQDERYRTLSYLEESAPDVLKDTLDTTASSDEVEVSLVDDWNDVEEGYVLAIYSGPDAGLYTVLQKYSSGGYKLRLDSSLTTTLTNVRWAVVHREYLTVNLFDPCRVILRASDFVITAGSALIQSSISDFLTMGVQVGHRLDIEGGSNEGSYFISAIHSSSSLSIDTVLSFSESSVAGRIVEAETPVDAPIRNIEQIEEVDATGRPTGSIIPYALPVDIRVIESFGNLDTGVKNYTSSVSTTAGSPDISCADFAGTPPSIGDRVAIYQGPNKGFYRVTELLTTTTVRLNRLLSSTEAARPFEYGSPSVGVARFYFLNPTSFMLWATTLYNDGTTKEREGSAIKYIDPSTKTELLYEVANAEYLLVPSPDEEVASYPLVSRTGVDSVSSATLDFNVMGIRSGDKLYLYGGPHAGSYEIREVSGGTIEVVGSPFASVFTNIAFAIYRPFANGIYSTEMQDNEDGPFYFVDMELVSLGTGDAYNRDVGDEMYLDVSSPHYKEGWWMHTENKNTTLSLYEELSLRFTPSYLEIGMPKQRNYNTRIQGTSARIKYHSSYAMTAMQDFVRYTGHRAPCSDPMVRHFEPVFLYTAFSYQGSISLATVLSSLKAMIEQTEDVEISVFDVLSMLRKRGVTDVSLPIELIGVYWKADRTIDVLRSTDRLSATSSMCFLQHTNTDGVVRL